MPLSIEQKLTLLRLIRERKDILFGNPSLTLTSGMKKEAWREIVKICRDRYSFNPVLANKSWVYLRDHTWHQWKTTAKKKRDHNNKIAQVGGRPTKYSEVDKAVLSILDDESAAAVISEELVDESALSMLGHEPPAADAPATADVVVSNEDDEFRKEQLKNLKLQNLLMETQIAYFKVKTEFFKTRLASGGPSSGNHEDGFG